MEPHGLSVLAAARKPAASASEAPRFYSVSQAARMFGTSPMTLYRAIADGEFPAVRIRGRLIVPAKAIEAMIEAAFENNAIVDAADFVPEGAV